MPGFLPHRSRLRAGLTALCLSVCLLLTSCASQPKVRISPATTAHAAGMVDLSRLAPDIRMDIRYAGSNNFIGRPITGYLAPKCYLLHAPAQALAQAQRALQAQGLGLVIFDCYRPVRAVQLFVAWAHDPADQINKARFYPDIDKPDLLNGYIAETSGHSRGATVDLGLVRCTGGHCQVLDMGTDHDWFGRRANTHADGLTALQRHHRQMLLDTMRQAGFINYPLEWWHYTWQPEPTPHTAYDVPVQ